jgi:hypothetical protein
MRPMRGVLQHVLAHHAGVPAPEIHPWQDLHHDLDLTPLEVVLIVLEIEGIEDVDVNVAGLADVETVDDLAEFLSREVGRSRCERIERDVA